MGNLSKLLPDVGSMDRLIDIVQYTETTDATGGVTETASDLATNVWCKVDYLTQSDEGMRGEEQQVVAWNRVKFTFRDYWSVTEKMRISFDGADYDILNISILGRDRFTVVEGEKRDNQT